MLDAPSAANSVETPDEQSITPVVATSSSPQPPPSAQVFNTFELLELILLNLDPRTLLLSSRVARAWNSVVTSSTPIRRALFFEPVPCGDVSYIDWRYDDKRLYDPYLDVDLGAPLRGPNRNQVPRIYMPHWGRARDDQGRFTVFVNPLLTKLFPCLRKDGLYWGEKTPDLPFAAQRPEASWQRMLFTQPAVNCVIIEFDHHQLGHPNPSLTPPKKSIIGKVHKNQVVVMECLCIALVEWRRGAWVSSIHAVFLEDWDSY